MIAGGGRTAAGGLVIRHPSSRGRSSALLVLSVLLLAAGGIVLGARWRGRARAALEGAAASAAERERLDAALQAPEDTAGSEERPTRTSTRRELVERPDAARSDSRAFVALEISSSAGFELDEIEVSTPTGYWESVPLDERGRARVHGRELPFELRAVAHANALATTADELVVLEPDALLTLEDPGGLLRATAPRKWSEPELLVRDRVLQRHDGARALLAIAEDLTDSGDELDFEWPLADGGLLELELVPSAGLRARSETPLLPEHRAEGDLVVEALRADESPCGPISARIEAVERPEKRNLVDARGARCGELRWLELEGSRLEVGSGPRATFAGLPLGVTFVLTVLEPGTGATAQVRVLHDGTPITVTLDGGRRVVGRLVPADEVVAPPFEARIHGIRRTRASARWALAGDSSFHELEDPSVPVARDGRFSTAVPEAPAGSSLAQSAADWSLTIDAPGFDVATATAPLGDEAVLDFGDIVLHRAEPELRIAPGHSLAEDTDFARAVVRFAGDAPFAFSVLSARATTDGALEVELALVQREPNVFSALDEVRHTYVTRTLPSPLPTHCVLELDSSPRRYVFLERDRDDPLREVASVPRAIRVRTEDAPDDGGWSLSLEWEGVSIPCERWTAPAPYAAIWRVAAPAFGAHVSWRREHLRAGAWTLDPEAGRADLARQEPADGSLEIVLR